VATRCINASCPAILRGSLQHWASRHGLDIDGLGEKLVQQLVERQFVRSVADLYELSVESLTELERMGRKSAENLVEAIAQSKQQPWSRVLYGLGIRYVGRVNAQTLTENFTSVDRLAQASIDDIEAVHGIGEEIARSVWEWFRVPANQELVERLKAVGLQLESTSQPESESIAQPLAGQKFVLTGSLPNLSRNEAKAKIEAVGGQVASSVSSQTDYIVVGDNPGSKLDKAVALNVPQLSESQLLELLESASKPARESTAKPLAGQKLVLTGSLPNLTREEAKTRIEAAGGQVTNSVSSQTDYIVVGDNPGSKLNKAQKLNITQLSEAQLLDVLENEQTSG
jgi:DNA ligase (NAD+)